MVFSDQCPGQKHMEQVGSWPEVRSNQEAEIGFRIRRYNDIFKKSLHKLVRVLILSPLGKC